MVTVVLHLVRHAEQNDPVKEDPADGLSEVGRAQARALATWFAERDEQLDFVVHSPLARAVETAAIVADQLELARVEHDGLRDRTPVPGPGREHEYPEKVRAGLANVPAAERDENGEHIARELGLLLAAPDGHTSDLNILVVTHAYVVASMVARATGMPAWRWMTLPVLPTGVTMLRFDGADTTQGQLLRFNDTRHLAAAFRAPGTEPG